MRAVVVLPIRGYGNAWGVAAATDPRANVRDRVVTLEIVGDPGDGYHLLMSPAGCFTADTWHESMEDATETAAEAFGVPPDGWSEPPDQLPQG